MFYRRSVANLRAQNWTAIIIELAIVVVGVFIGTLVANWNQERIDKRETGRVLIELKPALQSFVDFFDTAKVYYATTNRYGDRAFAGWRRDPAINDEQFVIAAYQASQIYVIALNGENWANIFGRERLRDIENSDVRQGLTSLMVTNYNQVEAGAVATRYREEVRKVIPEDIQDEVRAKCGDRPHPDMPEGLYVPPTCDLDIAPHRFAAAARALRQRPDLVGELRWHRAAVATFIANLDSIDGQTRTLQRDIDRTAR